MATSDTPEGTTPSTPSTDPGSVPEQFDIITIGSGMGSLTTAALLARAAGKRVLVLEQHDRLGGFTHAFSRKGYTWDVGLHYVGQMGGGMGRQLMDMVTGGKVIWDKVPSPFERFSYPDLEVRQPDDGTLYQQQLKEKFPHEADGIDRYFADVRRATDWGTRRIMGNLMPGPVAGLMGLPHRRLATLTTGQYLKTHIADERLRAVLTSQWGDYGLPPGQSSFVAHATIFSHYLRGAWYPRGGAGTIAEGARSVIEAAGGACLVKHEVERIDVEDGRAVGVTVRTRTGTRQFRAPVVVSGAGAPLTFDRLLPPGVSRPKGWVPGGGPAPTTVVNLYLGLKASPTSIGMTASNQWLYTSFDHDATAADRRALAEGRPVHGFLSFGGDHDREAAKPTAQVIAVIDPALFDAWRDTRWKKRGEDYLALKERITQALLDLVESRNPGFRDLVDYYELSTPLSVEHFSAHPGGAIYGLPVTPERFISGHLGTATPVKGLYLTGADSAILGIMGALMGGTMTAARILGPMGMPTIMKSAGRQRAA